MSFPRAFVPRPRRHGVVSQELDDELLLYVEQTHQASSLNAAARRLWALCDGERPMETIAAEAKLGQDVVVTALKQFSNAGLLENGAELATLSSTNLSRRRVLVGVGLAVPIILMVTAPGAAAAASCVGAGPCEAGQTCCAGGLCPSLTHMCE